MTKYNRYITLACLLISSAVVSIRVVNAAETNYVLTVGAGTWPVGIGATWSYDPETQKLRIGDTTCLVPDVAAMHLWYTTDAIPKNSKTTEGLTLTPVDIAATPEGADISAETEALLDLVNAALKPADKISKDALKAAKLSKGKSRVDMKPKK